MDLNNIIFGFLALMVAILFSAIFGFGWLIIIAFFLILFSIHWWLWGRWADKLIRHDNSPSTNDHEDNEH